MIRFMKIILFLIAAVIVAAITICLAFYFFDFFGELLRDAGVPLTNSPISPEDFLSFFKDK